MKKWHAENAKRFGDPPTSETILNEIFQKYPSNTDEKSVLLKATLLNSFYNTNVKFMANLGQHLISIKGFGHNVASGEVGLIEEMRHVSHGTKGKVIDYLSFAIKYCSRCVPDKFPIYDAIVSKLLSCYNKKEQYHDVFSEKELRASYKHYKEIVDSFIAKFISGSSYLDFDKYLSTMSKHTLDAGRW